jgi:hypothetical protein
MNALTVYDDKRHRQQDYFDTAVVKLFNQGGPSITGTGCKYVLGDRGCALGVLLDEREKAFFRQNEHLNGRSVMILIDEQHVLTRFKQDMQFVHDLQRCHDDAALDRSRDDLDRTVWHDIWSPSGVARRFQKLAIKYNLDATELYKTWGYPDKPGDAYYE